MSAHVFDFAMEHYCLFSWICVVALGAIPKLILAIQGVP